MNKAEIIRKISKKAGVPDTEAKKFFEIFLKHASDQLKPGESLNIHGVGLFQLRIGQIENRTTHDKEDKFIYSDLIVFTDNEDKEREEIIFNVPSGIEEQFQPVDSYFSLSVGKPIIPLKGVKETEFFIPPSGTELRSLIESKINRLLDESEKTAGGKETETIHLIPGDENAEEQFNRKDSGIGTDADETRVPSRNDFLKTREFENLSWDFGENLSQEIEEESILDFEKEQEAIENPAVDSQKMIEEPTDTVPLFEEEKYEETPDEDMFEEIIDEDINEPDIYEERTEEVNEPEQKKKSEDITEEIQNLKYEVEAEKNHDSVIPEHLVTEERQEVHSEKTEDEEPVLKNFQRVKSLTKEFNNTEFNETEEIEEEKPKKITEVRGGYQKVRRTTAEFDFDLSGIKGLDEIETPPVKEKKSSRKEYQGYRNRSSLPSLIVAFVVVIALAGVIFLYMKLKSADNTAADENKSAVSRQQTKVIERDYDVPVTYPYEKSGKKKPAELVENVKEQTGKNVVSLNTGNNINKSQTDLAEIRDPVNAERIGNYIFKYPEGIVVQTSSWKSKTIALSEVKKYREAGFTAFAEQSEIAGMGLYYRVRVGYFKSLQEAENFADGKQ